MGRLVGDAEGDTLIHHLLADLGDVVLEVAGNLVALLNFLKLDFLVLGLEVLVLVVVLTGHQLQLLLHQVSALHTGLVLVALEGCKLGGLLTLNRLSVNLSQQA